MGEIIKKLAASWEARKKAAAELAPIHREWKPLQDKFYQLSRRLKSLGKDDPEYNSTREKLDQVDRAMVALYHKEKAVVDKYGISRSYLDSLRKRAGLLTGLSI